MVDCELPNVSRETFSDLKKFETLVQKWTKVINLVSVRDATAVWSRHILDSLQVYENAPAGDHWVDLGSGGGFPGIVAAILSKGDGLKHRFTLVDSDQRKCTFLRTVSRELCLNVQVIDARIDALGPLEADILSARALDDLGGLLGFAEHHLKRDGTALFPKGATWKSEHEEAQLLWSYDLQAIESKTNPEAAILKIMEIARV